MTDGAASSSSMASAIVQPDVGAPGLMALSVASATGSPTCQVVGKGWPCREFPHGRDDDPSERWAEGLDRALNYALSRVTLGLSPASVAEAYFDWLVHLTAAPGKQLQLCQKALRKTLRFWHYAATRALTEQAGVRCIEPLPHDMRFLADAWHVWPYNTVEPKV